MAKKKKTKKEIQEEAKVTDEKVDDLEWIIDRDIKDRLGDVDGGADVDMTPRQRRLLEYKRKRDEKKEKGKELVEQSQKKKKGLFDKAFDYAGDVLSGSGLGDTAFGEMPTVSEGKATKEKPTSSKWDDLSPEEQKKYGGSYVTWKKAQLDKPKDEGSTTEIVSADSLSDATKKVELGEPAKPNAVQGTYDTLVQAIKKNPTIAIREITDEQRTGDTVFDLSQQNKFDEALREAKRLRKSDQENIGTRKAAVMFIHNLTQLLAAMWGQKNGVNMADLKFTTPDFDREEDLSRAEYAESVRETQKRRQNELAKVMADHQKEVSIAKLGYEEAVRQQKAVDDMLEKKIKESDKNKKVLGKARNMFMAAELEPDEKKAEKLESDADDLLASVLNKQEYDMIRTKMGKKYFGIWGTELQKRTPKESRERLDSFARGLSKGGGTPPKRVVSPEEVQEYANKHSKSTEEAKHILRQMGYQL